MPLPDFEAWGVFAKVAETGSFSRAAAELGVSKATASKAVARLERKLRTALFHRTSRRLSLTEAGRQALERAARMVGEAEAAEQEAIAQSVAPRGLIRLAAPMSFGIMHLAPALPEFLRKYPEIALDVTVSDQLADLVSDGFDLALRISSLTDSSLLARRLCTVRLLIVGAPTYFKEHERPKHPRDLAAHRCVVYAYARSPETWHLRHGRHGDYAVKIGGPIQANNAELVLPALRHGIALALLPEFLVWPEIKQGKLEIVLPDWQAPPIGLYLVTPPGGKRPSRVELLMEHLAKSFAKAPWASGH